MAYLPFISDEKYKAIVTELLTIGADAVAKADKKSGRIAAELGAVAGRFLAIGGHPHIAGSDQPVDRALVSHDHRALIGRALCCDRERKMTAFAEISQATHQAIRFE